MNDLHAEFADWIAAGARDELPRTVAVHASGCRGCLETAAAVDALAAIDPGAAEMPPVRIIVGASRGGAPARLARGAVGAAAVVLTVVAGFVVGGVLFEPAPEEVPEALLGTPGGAVLGDQGGPADSAAPSPSASSGEPSPSSAPSTTGAPGTVPSAGPTMGGGPPPVPPTATPPPTLSPTPIPAATPTPAPTPIPAATPTPTPTPAPTPTPEASCLLPLICPSPSLAP